MARRLLLSFLAILASFYFANAKELTAEDMDSIKISLWPESEGPIFVADKDKPILRYGFHRTHDCQNFDKAFVCVRKCLDLNYHIAHADKDCICTCYKNSILAKYKAPVDTASTKWKLGAPTTSQPSWAGGNVEKKPNDYEINANYTEFVEETKGPEDEAGNDAPEGEEGDGVTGDDVGEGEGSGEAGETTGGPEEVAEDAVGPPDEEAEAAPALEEAEDQR